MKLNDKQLDFLKDVANSDAYKQWIDVFETLINFAADIRHSPDLDSKVRLGVIQMLEDGLINKLKGLKGEKVKDAESWE